MVSKGTNSEDQIKPSGIIGYHNDGLKFDLTTKGFKFAHLNVQGQNMSKFSQLQATWKSPVNSALHLFGLSETKRKNHKDTIFLHRWFSNAFS